VLVGDANMEIGQLRFYPRSLTVANVEEIFEFGATLADISTVAIVIYSSCHPLSCYSLFQFLCAF
jgi:hypothetical protein